VLHTMVHLSLAQIVSLTATPDAHRHRWRSFVSQGSRKSAMTVKIRTFSSDQIDQLEAKLNEMLNKPESTGFTLAAARPIETSDGQVIGIIFQKS